MKCAHELNFVCNSHATPLSDDTKVVLEYTSEQLNFPFFSVEYKYKKASQVLLENWKDRKMTGFRLRWYFKGSSNNQTGSEKNINNEWKPLAGKPKYHDESFQRILQMTKEMKLTDLVKETIRNKVFKSSYWFYESKCTFKQRDKVMWETLNLLNQYKSDGVLKKEDAVLSLQLYAAITFCSDTSKNMFKFFKGMLKNSNKKETIQATVNTIRSGEEMENLSRKQLHHFYSTLEEAFDLQYGKILLATLDREELNQMMDLELPFIKQYKEEVKLCLEDVSCLQLQDIIHTLGKSNVWIDPVIKLS